MSGLIGKAMRLARSKQGKEALAKVQGYAKSEQGKERLESIKDKAEGLVHHKDKAEPAPPASPDPAVNTAETPQPDPSAPSAS